MSKEISFSNFTRELNVNLDTLSYNELTPSIEYDEEGNEIASRRDSIKVGFGEVYRLLEPYLSVRLIEQVRAVLPLAAYLALFQLFILRVNVENNSLLLKRNPVRGYFPGCG